jgi:CRISPR-associated endonuclease/helicase Cas3
MSRGKVIISNFWAKTTSDDKPGISVLEHMLNVGFVARAIAARRAELLRLFRLQPSIVAALAALHDLGKISPEFQQKCEEWLKERNLLDIARRWDWGNKLRPDHGKITHAALQKYFCESNIDEQTAMFLPAVLGGHHGRLNPPDDRGFRLNNSIVDEHSGIGWEKERKQAIGAVFSQFGIKPSEISIDDSSPALWWIGGLTSVADWIGSDERYFPPEGGMDASKVAEVAEKCLNEIGFEELHVIRGRSFSDLFQTEIKGNIVKFEPNKMQSAALSNITDRGVYIIEAPMGSGKTEAALGAAYNLLSSGKANGVYFALPTQATSNRMHLRMKIFVERISPGAVESKLIHSNSWLVNDKLPTLSPVRTIGRNEEDAETGRDWFSSAKRALIAPFGVGTMDQALLGVVAAKHFFVRQFALAGKVVILDEIHSYDLYTGTLIDRLIETLEKLGCTVIVLSATLSRARRELIVPSGKIRAGPSSKEPYPLITGRKNGKALKPLAISPPKPKTIGVTFIPESKAVSLAIDTATKGACVVWVCDTVDSAQRLYRQIRNDNAARFPIGLLHAHFPFWRREKLEEEWMTRLGKESGTRCGSILVSTQIVEQSVDLDADLMITELAPTDMMLQRMGRLWRHDRGKRPVLKPQIVILEEAKSLQEFRKIEAKEIPKPLGDKALVYDPYVLLRSLEEWSKLKKVIVPKDVRKLIEGTYKERKIEPKGWQKLLEEMEGKKLALKGKALMSSNIWNPALPDEEGVQTRINELPSLSLVLCRSLSDSSAEFIDGSTCTLGSEEFQLPLARAIHRNLVRIPAYHFETTEAYPSVARYLRGKHAMGFVETDGTVSAKGLKEGTTLRWDFDYGLIIERTKA